MTLEQDRLWIFEAITEARKVKGDIPVGAIVVLDGEVIARGYNIREALGDPTGHAEIVALRAAATKLGRWRLNGCTLYSTLEPCPMCAEASLQARVSRLVYGTFDVRSGAAGSVFNIFCKGRIYPLPEVIGGICEDECRNLLLEFFRENAKR